MPKKRVYELANELGIYNQDMLAHLERIGIAGKSHSSSLENDEVERIQKELLSKKPKNIMEQRIKTTVIRRRSVPVDEKKEKARPKNKDVGFKELYEQSIKQMQYSSIVTGKVVQINPNAIIIDVGWKTEGYLSPDEVKDSHGRLKVNVGDELEVVVEKRDEEGNLLLSLSKRYLIKTAYDENMPIKGTITQKVKGGFLVDVGVLAFLSASQIDIRPSEDMEKYVGQTYMFNIMKCDKQCNNIQLSRKSLLQHEHGKDNIKQQDAHRESAQVAVYDGEAKKIKIEKDKIRVDVTSDAECQVEARDRGMIPLSGIHIALSRPEDVERFRDIASALLEWHGELDEDLRETLEEKRHLIHLHYDDMEMVLDELVTNPEIISVMEKAVNRKSKSSSPTEDLAVIIERARPGDEIYLREKTYFLKDSLLLTKPIALNGLGADRTHIVGNSAEYVIEFNGDKSFIMRNLSVMHEGNIGADVVSVLKGQIDFRNCILSGGKILTTDDKKLYGCGLRISGNTIGRIQNCTIYQNENTGISIKQQAQPTLEGNICRGNKYSGIGYYNDAAGTARNNVCKNNQSHGIYISDQAHPTLEGNINRGNERSGISYHNDAAGAARNNVCENNQSHGIYVSDQAHPTLEGNICWANGLWGIVFIDNSGGKALNNYCDDNFKGAVGTTKEAKPVLGNYPGNNLKLVLPKDICQSLAIQGSEVIVTLQQLCKNRQRHDEITRGHFRGLSSLINNAQLVVREEEKNLLLLSRAGKNFYFIVIRINNEGGKMYLKTFRKACKQEADRLKRKGQVIRDQM